jgi:hypothetical protein
VRGRALVQARLNHKAGPKSRTEVKTMTSNQLKIAGVMRAKRPVELDPMLLWASQPASAQWMTWLAERHNFMILLAGLCEDFDRTAFIAETERP